MATLAGGASAVRRANGECFIECLPGSHCNRATGLCDPLACNDSCTAGFVCEETETGSACVPHDEAAELASRPQMVPSGAQPFGDGQAVNGPHVGPSLTNGIPAGASGGEGALPVPPGAIATHAGASDRAPSSAPAKSSPGPGDAGPTSAQSADGGVARLPAAALQTSPQRQKDPQGNSSPSTPWIDLNNPWDPHHADPSPQMSNPNQPPPH